MLTTAGHHHRDNDVDHDAIKFQIKHDIKSLDTIFMRKSLLVPTSTVISVSDDDTAGINIDTNIVTLAEDGIAKFITVESLNSKPVSNVLVEIHVPSNIVVAPKSFIIHKREWSNITNNQINSESNCEINSKLHNSQSEFQVGISNSRSNSPNFLPALPACTKTH